MSDNLSIVRAVYSGLSQRQAATTHHVSRNTVALLLRHARTQGWLTLEDLNYLDNSTFSKALTKSAGPSRDVTFKMPDYEYVHAELAKPNVTLKLLWEEYVVQCRANGDRFYMETQFRQYYHKFARVHKATIRLEHKPALSMEVDWAGTKVGFFEADTGKMSESSLFVSVLPCSQLIYAEPFRNEKLPSWIAGHAHAFQYFEGVPKTLVPDNLKAGVQRSNFYEPDLNRTYQEMATYYGTVILPARVRKPRDKSSVENSVLIASRRILARIRNIQILSFADLQYYIRTALEQVNEAPLTGKSESRWSSYLAEEKDYMLPLPASPYELAQWGKAKVQTNCHIAFQRKFYSVPFEHIGEEVDIRATQSTVEIFYHHQRIASHKRLWGKANYATIKEHMPPDKIFFTDWNRERFITWAEKIGCATRKVVEAIIDRAVVEQQAYRSCFGLLNLHGRYGAQRLERSSRLILSQTATPTYQQLKNIMEKNMDIPVQSLEKTEHKPPSRGVPARGRLFRR
jgi:transposase